MQGEKKEEKKSKAFKRNAKIEQKLNRYYFTLLY